MGRMLLFHMFGRPTSDSPMSLFVGANAKKPAVAIENFFDKNGNVNFEVEEAMKEWNLKTLHFVLEGSRTAFNYTKLEQGNILWFKK